MIIALLVNLNALTVSQSATFPAPTIETIPVARFERDKVLPNGVLETAEYTRLLKKTLHIYKMSQFDGLHTA